MNTDIMAPTFPLSHPKIKDFRIILMRNKNGYIDGYNIDVATAKLVCQVYDQIDQIDFRNRLMDLLIPALICTCWKLSPP